MSFLGKASPEIVVAGCQNTMFRIDAEQGLINEEVCTYSSPFHEHNRSSIQMSTGSEYTMMKFCRYIVAGTSQGRIHLLEPETMTVIKEWEAHSSKINWMDAQNNYLVTCGWTTRPHAPPMLDRLAKVFDLSTREQLAPISFPSGAAYVQMHPKMSTTAIIASQSGQLQVVDIHNPNTFNVHHANIGYSSFMAGLVMAPSGEAWGLVDQDNAVILWGSPKTVQFSEPANPTVFADEKPATAIMELDSDL